MTTKAAFALVAALAAVVAALLPIPRDSDSGDVALASLRAPMQH